MKKVRGFKHVRALAWLMAICLGMTGITPSFTVFASDEYAVVSEPGNEDEGLNTKDDESPDNQEDAAESKDEDVSSETEDDEEDEAESCDAAAGEQEKEAPGEDEADPDGEESGRAEDETGSKDDESYPAGDDEFYAEEDDESYPVTDDDTADVNENKPAGYVDGRKDEINTATDKKEKEDEEEDDALDGLIDEENTSSGYNETATPSDAEKYVCEYNGEYYESFEAAVESLGNGSGTITLISDASLEKILYITGSEIILDLGGFTLSGVVYVTGAANVTVKNGTIDSGKNYWAVFASGNDDDPTIFTLAKDAKIKAEKYGLLICGVSGSNDPDGAGFMVTIDGTVEASDKGSSGIWLQGKMKNTNATVCDLTVNGTVICGNDDGPGIAINGWGNVTVNEGAKISGAVGIELRAGSLCVNGGTITGAQETYVYWPNTNGSTSKNAGITINGHTTGLPLKAYIKGGDISGYYALAQIHTQNAANDTEMIITGGTFTGYDNTCAIKITDYGNSKDIFSIFGGTFLNGEGNKSDISSYLTGKYTQDNTGKVSPVTPAFELGDVSFAGIEDAISAIQDDENPTITLAGNVEDFDPAAIAEEQELNIDLGDYTLSFKEGEETGLLNKGKLTISGSGTISADNMAIENEGGSLAVDPGVSIISKNDAAISNKDGDLVIYGTVMSENASAIVSEGGMVNVSEGSITGKTAIEVKSGSADINGGTLSGENAVELINGTVYISGGSLNASNGYAVYISENLSSVENTRAKAPYLIVRGGTFITEGDDCIYIKQPRDDYKPVLVYCGEFSVKNGLDRYYATDKTKGLQRGRYFEVLSYEEEKITEPDCTDGGDTRYTCSVCGKVYSTDAKAPLGHDWGKWEITQGAISGGDGIMSRECMRCGETETELYTGSGDCGGSGTGSGDTESGDTGSSDTGGSGCGSGDGESGNTGSGDSSSGNPAKDDDNGNNSGAGDNPGNSDVSGSESTGSSGNAGTGTGSGSGGSHHGSSGGGSSSGTRPTNANQTYVGTNGKTANWTLSGMRFKKADGTYPSNEYLIINGVIYAFYNNGYAVSFDRGEYYSRDVVPAIEDIPVVSGTWSLCGWWLQYSDGYIPKNEWAQLTHEGRTDKYYFDADGWMETGWKQIGGYWYYFGTDGAMLYDTQTPDGHTVDANGRMIR